MGSMDKVERIMSRFVGRAIHGYDMLKEGDRVIAAVSGGSDSLAMLYWLSEWKRRLGFGFDLIAINLMLDFGMMSNKEELKAYCSSLGVSLEIVKVNPHEVIDPSNPCYTCSRYRRISLFRYAEKHGFNKIALGHNRDDLVVTFFMNMMFHGEIATLKPVQSMFSGRFEIIRPLIFLRKETIRKWLRSRGIKEILDYCPYKYETYRKKVEDILFNVIYPINEKVRNNIFKAIFNVKKEFLPEKPKHGRF
jgi:tRNA 2-thiocytidine biosynthesis protein TtcA